jgi:hypothetical protein
MSGFTKLDSEILTSTIWSESAATKVVWITILAMMDRRSEVHGSVPGLARIAGVETEECRQALQAFMLPDKDSRSKEHEGRRLREIDGGWLVLNGDKYRAKYSREWKKERDAARLRSIRVENRVHEKDDVSPIVAQRRARKALELPLTSSPAIITAPPSTLAEMMPASRALTPEELESMGLDPPREAP